MTPESPTPTGPPVEVARFSEDRRYSNADRKIVLAAIDRYGTTLGRRELSIIWEAVPSAKTILRWRSDGDKPDEHAAEFWLVREGKRTAQLKVQIADRLAPALAAFDKFVAEGASLKMQQAAVAIGILYDKLVPPPNKGGPAVSVTAEPGATVQMLVIAPSEVEGAKHRAIA